MAETTTSPRDNAEHLEAVARRLYDELWNAGRFEIADELFDPDFHYVLGPGSAPKAAGPEAKLAAIRAYRQASPDVHLSVDALVVQGNEVAVRWTATHTDTAGFRGRPPTGRRITASGADFLTFRDGRIIADWIAMDRLGTFVQLGVLEDPWT